MAEGSLPKNGMYEASYPICVFNSEFNVYNLHLEAALMIKVYLLQ